MLVVDIFKRKYTQMQFWHKYIFGGGQLHIEL